MLKIISAGLAAVLLVSPAALAQSAPQTDGARGERARGLSADDREALVDARIAALRTALKLTPDQDKNWPAVEGAIRDLAKQRAEFAAQGRENRERAVQRDPIERLRSTADIMSARAAALKKFADAAEPLYRSLDDGQKRRLTALTRRYAMGRHFVPRRPY